MKVIEVIKTNVKLAILSSKFDRLMRKENKDLQDYIDLVKVFLVILWTKIERELAR